MSISMSSQIDKANKWSSHGKDYNAGQSKPLTFAAIKTCFDAEIFTLLDSIFSKASKDNKVQILTLACGTGSELLVLFDHYGVDFLKERCEILATDYAEGMVQVTGELMESLGANDFVKVQQMDAQKIDLALESIDVVLFAFGPMMLPDPIKALSEILRVLKPNGLSVNITPSSMDFYSFLNDAKSAILKARGLDPEKNKDYEWSFYNNRAIVQWGRTDAVKKHFSGAGFEEDKLKAEMVEVKVNIDDWRLTISSLKTNPGMAYFWNDLTASEGDTFWRLLNESFEKKYGPDGKCEMRQGVVLSWGWK